MRAIVIAAWSLATAVLGACDRQTSSGGPAASQAQSASAGLEAILGPPPPARPPRSAPRDPLAFAVALEDAWSSHDATRVAALYADHAARRDWVQDDFVGREAIAQDASRRFSMLKDVRFVRGRVWAKDTHTSVVEVVWTGTATREAPSPDQPASRPYGVVGALWLERDDDGLIKDERDYVDGLTMLGQILAPDAKNPVRAPVVAPPDGTDAFVGSRDDGAGSDEPKDGAPRRADIEKTDLDVENHWIAAFDARKLDEGYSLVADGMRAVDYTEATNTIGIKDFKEHTTKVLAAFPDMQAQPTRCFAARDYVACEVHETGTQKGPLGSAKPTNRWMSEHRLVIDQVVDHKLARSWSWANGAEIAPQLAPGPHP